jgi:hypothetical protein
MHQRRADRKICAPIRSTIFTVRERKRSEMMVEGTLFRFLSHAKTTPSVALQKIGAMSNFGGAGGCRVK